MVAMIIYSRRGDARYSKRIRVKIMPKRKPKTPLPAVGENDERAHAQISDRFQEHAVIEIDKENRLQAAEKVWASVAHAVKAVAEYRGWEHDSHSKLYDVARQLGTEAAEASSKSRRTRPKKAAAFVKHFDGASRMHDNFYENGRDWPDILDARDDAQVFIAQLNAFRDQPPGRFRLREPADQRRVARLLGLDKELRDKSEAERQAYLDRVLPLRSASPVGFSPAFGFRLPGNPDDDGGGIAVEPSRPDGPAPAGGQLPSPSPGNGIPKNFTLKPGQQRGQDDAAGATPPRSRRPRKSQNKDGQPTTVNIRFG